MASKLSERLRLILEALPRDRACACWRLVVGRVHWRRAMAARIGDGHVLAIDRSARAIAQAVISSRVEIMAGRLSFREVAAEAFMLEDGEMPYDLAVAIRVGALDGDIRRPARRCGFASRLR